MLQSMRERLGFDKKLLLGILTIVLLTIVIMAGVNIVQTKRSYVRQGHKEIKNVADGLFKTMTMQHKVLWGRTESDLSMLSAYQSVAGKPALNQVKSRQIDLHRLSGRAAGRLTVPKLMFGVDFVTNDIVDKIASVTGARASVYQLAEDELVCVASSLREQGGRPEIGRAFPSGSPMLRTLKQGKRHQGIRLEGSTWYVTMLTPFSGRYSDQVIGALAVARPLLSPDFRDLVANTDLRGKGTAMLIDGQGRLIIPPQSNPSAGTLDDLPYGQALQGIEQGNISYSSQGRKVLAHVRSFDTWNMRYAVSVPESELMAGVNAQLLKNAALSAVLALIVAGLFIWLIKREIMIPMRRLATMASSVANGDFQADFQYKAKDLIGETVTAVRHMVEEIKNRFGFAQGIIQGIPLGLVVVDTKETITFINQSFVDSVLKQGRPDDYTGRNLAEVVYHDASRTTVISQALAEDRPINGVQREFQGKDGSRMFSQFDSAPLHDLDGQLIGGFTLLSDLTEVKEQQQLIERQNQEITRTAEQANTISEQVSTAADQLSAQVEQANTGAEQQKERIAETASSIEEMSNTVLEVSRNASYAAESGEETKKIAQEGADVVNKVVESIAHIRTQAESLQQNINTLGEKAEGVGQVMDVIEDIADQTNLLALNAAIEAARAGEAGRGFAVVADEVRKLAEKTMNATKEVGQAVSEIQDGTRNNIQNTEETVSLIQKSTDMVHQAGQALQRIVDMVESSADQISSIATAVEEQSTTTDEINQAVEEINRISAETSDAMSQSAGAVNELASQAQSLKALMDDLLHNQSEA